ncbi:TonB-dependent receptor domain-containing protein [uncultured Desulfobacter sp.]|uniref:TonB-dependent receptor n=1 Tax=uncultured Desulfobacter sp. TaxID=240139 RepID=UPI0029F4ECFA
MTYQFTDRFSATFGLRYDDDHREIRDYHLDVYEEADYSAFSPKFALQYKINNQISTYATVAKGYKSGGFYAGTASGYPIDYDQETLWNYEIGIKSVWMDNRLMLNVAAYYMDISDMQVLTMIDSDLGYISNAAGASSMGLELEGNYIINKNFSAFANFSVGESTFDNFSDADGDYDGNYNPYAPVYTYAVGLKFRGGGGFFAGINVTGYGKSYLDKANQYEHDAYELVNAKIGYEWEHVDFYVYGNNIFDKEYNLEGVSGYYVMLSDPGEFGVRLTWRF